MNRQTKGGKMSQTALFAALYRAVANREFNGGRLGPDHMAALFLPAHFRFFVGRKFFRKKIIAKSGRVTPGMYEYILARTAFFDVDYAVSSSLVVFVELTQLVSKRINI